MEKFHSWTVTAKNGERWDCVCECGTRRQVRNKDLRNGKSKSCGCLVTEKRKAVWDRKKIHGMADSPTRSSWTEMKRRCYATHRKEYVNYGGRGIKVCDRWLESFSNFLADMGVRPDGHTLDRIDNDSDYTPTNCRWLLRADQELNKRSNRRYDIFGETITLAEAARKYNINVASLYSRIHLRGWDVERAVSEPIDTRYGRH